MNFYFFWKKVKAQDRRSKFCNEYRINEGALKAADDLVDKLKGLLR
jgi:hypothetical protein